MRKSPRQTKIAPIQRSRFAFIAIFFCCWVIAIAGRLVWLQVFQHRTWVDLAARQQQAGFEVAPRRGVLYDRNLRELAMTVSVDSIYAVPSELAANKEDVSRLLARIVHADPTDNFTAQHQMLARFNASHGFAWVARRVDPEIALRVRELSLKGVYFQKEFKRFYPNQELAAQVLGYVGTDDTGLGGLEHRFDDDMHGTPGHMLTAVDAKRHRLGSSIDEPQPGENLVLTIDANIQYMAERALDAQMAKVKGLHGTVVVQDPKTGQILALAVSPRFNPNDSKHMDVAALTNLAVTDVYEPGSTFKLVTYSAAIDGAGVEPTDMVDCQGGRLTMFGRTLHDDKTDMGMGVVTVQRALEKSSDVGAAKMALKLGPDKFYSYIKGYGFGERTGIELPSETRGLLQAPRRWGATSILSIAIGQEIAVTPVQLVTMVGTIANGGVYMPPHILLAATDQMKGDPRLRPAAFHPQNELPATLPDGAHRVIKELTAAKMRSMMQGVVTEGTGAEARLNGYSSGGKTGTANKIDVLTKTYSHTKIVASFAGFAPVSNPAIAVAVVIDTPTVGILYGSAVSAPVFREVAQQVLEYLGVPHDQPLKSKKELLASLKTVPPEAAPTDTGTDLTAMFSGINNLPPDDPLRTVSATAAPADEVPVSKKPANFADKMLVAFDPPDPPDPPKPLPTTPRAAPSVMAKSTGGVVVDAGQRVPVPSFMGAPLRGVIERASQSGLRVQPIGTGLATDQIPAPGTLVPAGTEVLVHFNR